MEVNGFMVEKREVNGGIVVVVDARMEKEMEGMMKSEGRRVWWW